MPNACRKYVKWKQGERILNRYEVMFPQPKVGGMGCVYICLDHRHKIPVAIKTLKENIGTKSIDFLTLLEKFRLEAEAWVRLEKHRNIVQAKRVEVIESQPYIILEYINAHEKYGADLSHWIKNKKFISVIESLNFAIQFCSGMEHAENIFNKINKPFVHRDVKPANIMVTPDGVIKITDFGLVKIFDDAIKDAFAFFGSLRYMSPEQFQADKAIDTRSDIYSFGCVLYEMLSKGPPFLCCGYLECKKFHEMVPPTRIETLVSNIPDDLSKIIDRCLKKDKRERFVNFKDLKKELLKVYHSLTFEEFNEPTNAELLAWERIQKGISLCNLGYRKESVTNYLQALEVDKSAAKQLVPATVAMVRDIYCKNDRNEMLIVLVLSIYVNEKNQKSIAEILDLFATRYGFRLISIEGGSGKIDLSDYRKIPNDKRKKEIAEQLLNLAKINGTEFFAITTTQDILLYGAEDEELFDKNTNTFISGLSFRDTAIRCCDSIKEALNILKPHLYNSRLKAFDKKVEENKHKYDFGYFLRDQMKMLSINDTYPNLFIHLEAIEIERQINQNLLNKEKDSFFLEFSKHLSQDLFESVNKAIYDLTAKVIEDHEFYTFINSIIKEHFTEDFLNVYPNFKLLIKRMLLRNKLDRIKLFSELDQAEESVRCCLYSNLQQRELDLFLKYIILLKKGYENKITPSEKMIFDKIRINITDNNLVNFIRLHAIRNGIGFSIADSISADIENKSRSICLPLYSERVSKFLENTDGFYSIANQRSKSIIKNCLNQLNLENELAGILVTGGFHRNTITTYLKEMKIPFIVLQPKTELSEEDDKRYISAVLENRKNN